VPLHIRNAPTKLMKELDYGKDYKYAHDYADAYVSQEYLPDEIKGQVFYQPKGVGFEKTIKERLNYWRQKKKDAES
jgi:putative ATPase